MKNIIIVLLSLVCFTLFYDNLSQTEMKKANLQSAGLWRGKYEELEREPKYQECLKSIARRHLRFSSECQ